MIELIPDDRAAAAAELPADNPLVLVNLLRFRDQAHYPGSSVLQAAL